MRHLVTKAFKTFLENQTIEIGLVAIVGGSSMDPEVDVIKEMYPGAIIHYFDIDNPANDANFRYLDINSTHSIPEFTNCFDLIVSSQVLEHIWNHEYFFDLISDMSHPGGLIWINCPRSNLEHGSPHYFSAGFTSSYLESNFSKHGFEITNSGEVGNKRYYLATHFARYWQTSDENRRPLLKYNFQPGSNLGILKKFIFELPSRLLLVLLPNANSTETKWATESFIGARKI